MYQRVPNFLLKKKALKFPNLRILWYYDKIIVDKIGKNFNYRLNNSFLLNFIKKIEKL